MQQNVQDYLKINKSFLRGEMSGLINCFKEKALNPSKQIEVQNIEKTLAYIMLMELEELEMNIKFDPENYDDPENNDITLNFQKTEEENDNSAGTFLGYRGNKKPVVNINLYYYKQFLEDKDPDFRQEGCKKMIRTLLHEIRHYKQYLMTKTGISSKDNLRFARDYTLISCLEAFYEENYFSYTIENDANAEATKRFEKIMGESRELKRAEYLYEGERETGNYKYYRYDRNGKIHDAKDHKDDVSINCMDYLICETESEEERESIREDIFKEFPILLKEYNLDCTRKTLPQLMYEMEKEQAFLQRINFIDESEKQTLITDSKEMYYELFYKAIENMTYEDYKEILQKYDVSVLKDLLRNIDEYFEKEAKKQIRLSEKMQVVQSRDGYFPNPYYTEEEPLAALLKRNDSIYKRYAKKQEYLGSIGKYIEKLEKTKQTPEEDLVNHLKNLQIKCENQSYIKPKLADKIIVKTIEPQEFDFER